MGPSRSIYVVFHSSARSNTLSFIEQITSTHQYFIYGEPTQRTICRSRSSRAHVCFVAAINNKHQNGGIK